MASYVVKSGDSLSKIARDVVGDINRWQELAELNFLDTPYIIYPGEVLDLPDDVTPRQAQVVASGAAAGARTVTGRPWWKNPWLWFLATGVLALGALPRVRRQRHRSRRE